MAIILDGKKLANKITDALSVQIKNDYILKSKPIPSLAVVLVGDNSSSLIYVNTKKRACEKLNIPTKIVHLPNNTTQQVLDSKIIELNKDKTIAGIILQLPLPKGLCAETSINNISCQKDVDGLTLINQGKLFNDDFSCKIPCTPLGIIRLLEEYKIDIEGKNAVIVGRSNLVGKPLAMLLSNRNATVTMCHSKTQNLAMHTKLADIVIAAAGKINLITADMIKRGAVVIDVGINRKADGSICGDIDFAALSQKASYITPVPGGVGPMTVAMLLHNLLN